MASSTRRRRARRSRGQSLVEVALTLPFLLSLLGFGGDIARAFFVNTEVSNATREGALYAGHHYGDSSLTTFAQFKTAVSNVVMNEESTPLIGCPSGSQTIQFLKAGVADPGTGYPVGPGGAYELTIQVDCSVRPIVNWLPTPNPMHLTAKTTAYVYKENP